MTIKSPIVAFVILTSLRATMPLLPSGWIELRRTTDFYKNVKYFFDLCVSVWNLRLRPIQPSLNFFSWKRDTAYTCWKRFKTSDFQLLRTNVYKDCQIFIFLNDIHKKHFFRRLETSKKLFLFRSQTLNLSFSSVEGTGQFYCSPNEWLP